MEKNKYKYSYGKPYRVIAVCLTKFHDKNQEDFIKEFTKKAEEQHCKLMIFTSMTDLYNRDKNDEGEEKIFSLFDVSKFDLIVILTETFKKVSVAQDIARRGIEKKIPVISVDYELKDCINISFSFGDSFEKIVRHIIEDHHLTKINFIAGVKGNRYSEERLDCYKRVLKDNHINFEEERVGYGDFWENPTYHVVRKWINSGNPLPEAIICANDTMAIATIKELRNHGLDVPRDIIVSGFDGIELERYHIPRITTAEYDLEKVINTIYEIIHMSEKTRAENTEYTIDFKYRKGGSCGCVLGTTTDANTKVTEMAAEIVRGKDFHQRMYNMMADLNSLSNIKEIIERIPHFLDHTFCQYFWLCLNESIINEQMEFHYNLNGRKNHGNNKFSNKLFTPIQKLENNYIQPVAFEKEELLPNISEILERVDYLIFVSMNFQETVFGYAAVHFNVEKYSMESYQSLIMTLTHVIENARNHSEQENLYIRDTLTMLYNRRGFYKYIGNCMENCIENHTPLTVISIDMDGLKSINDKFGHLEGDFAIRKISQAMVNATLNGEIASRFGGDEFVIAFGGHDGANHGKLIELSMMMELEKFNKTNEKPYKISASFGIFTHQPNKRSTLDYYIKNADEKMYREKMRHKGV